MKRKGVSPEMETIHDVIDNLKRQTPVVIRFDPQALAADLTKLWDGLSDSEKARATERHKSPDAIRANDNGWLDAIEWVIAERSQT